MNEMKGIQFGFLVLEKKEKKLFHTIFLTLTNVAGEGRIYKLSGHMVHLC